MLREFSSGLGAVCRVVRFKAEGARLRTVRLGTVGLSLGLFLAMAWPPGKLFAQGANAGSPANRGAQSEQVDRGVTAPDPVAHPTTVGMPAGVLPPAMASKSKMPAESDYEA